MTSWPRRLVGVTLLLFLCVVVPAVGSYGKTPPTLADLVKKLGADDWRTRERATETLTNKMDLKLYEELKGVKTKDLEVEQRISSVLKQYEGSLDFATYKATKNSHLKACYKGNLYSGCRPQLPTSYPLLPWLDRMEGWDYSYLQKAQKAVGCGGHPHWHDYRYATYLWLDDQVNAKIEKIVAECKSDKEVKAEVTKVRQVLQQKLDQMVIGEDKWWGCPQKNPVRLWWGPKP